MTLPWVRIDSELTQHPKILALVHDPSRRRWQAAFSYVCAIGWSAACGTDGEITREDLPVIHATPSGADLLVRHGLLEPTQSGWLIHNFTVRQLDPGPGDIRRRRRLKRVK